MTAEINSLTKSVRRLGFWSAALTAAWTVWFIGAFVAYLPYLPAEWTGIESFAASFESAPYVAWVLPCLLLALTFPVLMSSIHSYAPDDKRIWSRLGLVFAMMYGALLAATYWVLLTVVRQSLLSGYTEGLAWFVIGSPPRPFHPGTGASPVHASLKSGISAPQATSSSHRVLETTPVFAGLL